MSNLLHALFAAALGSALPLGTTSGANPDALWCPAVVMMGDAAELRAHIGKIHATEDYEKRSDLMVEFRYCIKVRGLAVMRDRRMVMTLADLLDDWPLIVDTAYLLGEIGPAARPALPRMRAVLAAQPDPADANGFVFNRDRKPIGALEIAVAQIEHSPD